MTCSLSARRALLAVLLMAGTLAALIVRVSPAGAAGTQVLHLSAKAHMVLRFSTNHLSAHRGRIELVMRNPSNAGMAHGIAIQGHGVNRKGPIVRPGRTSTVTVTLTRKGAYTYYCPVPGHRQAGMKGTLTVS